MKVSAPPEDPEEKAAADAESARADAAAVTDTQDVLDESDRKRLRVLGTPSLTGGSVTGTGGYSSSFSGYGATAPITGGFSGGSFTGGGGGGASKGTSKQ